MFSIRKFARNESGHTVFALVWLTAIIGVTGLALDSTNAWRVKEELRSIADAGAHAAAVVLASPPLNDPADPLSGEVAGEALYTLARNHARTVVNKNLERLVEYKRTDGTLIEALQSDLTSDIKFHKWDDVNNEYSTSGTSVAVAVRLHRDATVSNELGTIFLRAVGIDAWQVNQAGVAALEPFDKCAVQLGLFASDRIRTSSQNTYTNEQCVSSNTYVNMPQQNTFNTGLTVSMPNLARCIGDGKCDDNANPGIEAAMAQYNIIYPNWTNYIVEAAASFRGTVTVRDHKGAFYDREETPGVLDVTLGPLAPLTDLGIDVSTVNSAGDVLVIDQEDFEKLGATGVPTGITYDIQCKANGNGSDTKLEFDNLAANSPSGRIAIDDIAIVTNCGFEFGSLADITGSMLISERDKTTATVRAEEGAVAGTTALNCATLDPNSEVYVMSLGPMSVPAKFVVGNITFITDDNVDIASGSSIEANHFGLNIFAGGSIDLTTKHNLTACPSNGSRPFALVPFEFKYITLEHANPWLTGTDAPPSGSILSPLVVADGG